MTAPAAAGGIILAENDPLMRGLLRSILVRTDRRVFPARDGLEAVMLAQQFPAGLVLLDVSMPRLNGLLACEAIRALPGYASVPIVMLTGHDDERLRKAARRLGATAYLTKPFRPPALLAEVAGWLGMPSPDGAAWDGDLLSSGRVQVWKIHQDPRPAFGEHPGLAAGREIIHLQRKAEAKERE